jgi:hypothetical protein
MDTSSTNHGAERNNCRRNQWPCASLTASTLIRTNHGHGSWDMLRYPEKKVQLDYFIFLHWGVPKNRYPRSIPCFIITFPFKLPQTGVSPEINPWATDRWSSNPQQQVYYSVATWIPWMNTILRQLIITVTCEEKDKPSISLSRSTKHQANMEPIYL